MLQSLPLLSVLIWLPILAGMLVLLLGSEHGARAGKFVALGASVLTFVLSVPLYTGFDALTADMQFVERLAWISRFEAYYHLGVDGISMPLVLLTTFLTPLVVIAGKGHEQGQEFEGGRKLPFDDRAVAREELRKLEPMGGTA